MKSPLVSIITACYNGEKYIRKLLDSVLLQNYSNIEFIIIDDGSTDKSLQIIKQYTDKFHKNNIAYKIYSKENGGTASAVNVGLGKFSGEYVTFIDADDFLNDDSIQKRVDFLEANKEYDAVYSETNVVNENNYDKIINIKVEIHEPYRTNLFLDMLQEKDYIWTPAYLIRSTHFLHSNPKKIIAEFKAGQNIQLFLPLWYKGVVGYIDEPLVTIVEHSDSHSRIARSEEDHNSRLREIEQIYLDTLHRMNIPKAELNKYVSLLHEKQKRNNPRVFTQILSDKDELAQLYDYDEQKFRESYVSDINTSNQNQIAAKLVFSSHSLEKSLSNGNFEIGHGFRNVELLSHLLRVYKDKGFDQTHLGYTSTVSVLCAFYEKHIDTEYADKIEDIFLDLTDEIKSCTSDIGGSSEIYLRDKKNNDKKNFKELSEGRFAVRSYSKKPVKKADIEEAVSIATKSPTVCNRQSVKVRAIYDKKIIERVLEVQGGIAYYDTPPVLLLITADDNGYVGPNERNQGFIDGGLFAMSVLYALEYKKLAACPLHAMFTEVPEKTIRGMLNLADSEKLITFISVGHFDDVSNVCKSFRYPASHILSEVSEIYDFTIKTIEPPRQEKDNYFSKIRKKARIRTRLRTLRQVIRLRTRFKDGLRSIKHKTRVRTRMRNILKKNDNKNSLVESREPAYGAIVTLTGYFNYGNIIQRYALQEFLRQNKYNFISYAQEPLILQGDIAEKYRHTADFVSRNIWRKPYEENDNFSAYIVGSDQVWRNWDYENEERQLGYYFLDFIEDPEIKRIAYAVSLGKSTVQEAGLTNTFIGYSKNLVKSFDAIGMREDTGVISVKNTWNVDAKQVLDPTMLLRAKDYNKLISNCPDVLPGITGIFTYILISSPAKQKIITDISEATGMEVTGIGLEDTESAMPHVEFWLKGFRDADIVVTDSFHGMVFSIINNTNFFVIESEFGGVARLESLLKQLGLGNRLIRLRDVSSISVDKVEKIDWVDVNRRLEVLRKDSSSWLIDTLKN